MCFTDGITFINNIFNKHFPLTHLAYDILVKIYQIQIRFENYFGNYFRIFTITFINKVNSISLRDLSRNQLMKLVKHIRFQKQIAFTELSYHFKMSLNFTHTQKNILNEYSISISNQSKGSISRGNFDLKIRFQNRVFMSKSTLNFVFEVGTSTWNLNSVLLSILKIKLQFLHIDFRHLDQFWNRSCSILNYFT